MPLNLISTDTFRDAVKSGGRPDCRILRASTADATEVEGEQNTFSFTCSDESVDRAGDVIRQSGWQNLKEFEEQNAVGLWAHDSSAPPIGRWKNMRVTGGNGSKLKGDLEFAPEEVYPFAGTLAKLVRGKFLNAVSVGFIPVEWEFAKEKERQYGLNFIKQNLLEVSLCPIPANPNALIEARAAGIDTRPIREWAEKILDGGETITIPRQTLVEIFKASHTPHSVRDKYKHLTEPKPAAEVVPAAEAPAAEVEPEEDPMKTAKSGEMPGGSCGRAKDMECGMKDPVECSIHAPETKSVAKSGRRISAKTKSDLQKVMDMHEECMKSLKAVIEGADDEGDDSNGDDDQGEPGAAEDPAEKRKAAIAALRAQLKH